MLVHGEAERLLRVGLVVELLLFVEHRLVEGGQLFRADVVLARQRDLAGDALASLS